MYSIYIWMLSRLRKKLIRMSKNLYNSGLVYPEELFNLNQAIERLLSQIIVMREIQGGSSNNGQKNEEKEG